MYARKLDDLDFRVGGGDVELVVDDHFVMPEHVVRGELEAALAIPEAAISQLRERDLELMYDGKLPYEVYGETCSLPVPGRDGQQLHGHEEVVRRAPRDGGRPRRRTSSSASARSDARAPPPRECDAIHARGVAQAAAPLPGPT